MNKNFSFKDAFADGWAKLKEHWVFLLAAYATIFFASAVFTALSEGPYKGIEPTSGIFAVIGGLLRIWLNFNFLVITIHLFDGEKPKWTDLFLWHEETLSYVGASILYGMIVILGLVAFIIPGLYFMIKYCFYGFLIADKKVGAFDSLKMSGQLTDGVKWLIVGFTFASIGIIILGTLALGVGLFIALPVVSLALIFVYRSLYDQAFNLAAATPAAVVVTPAVEVPVAATVPAVESKAPEVAATPTPEKTEVSKSDTTPTPPAA